MYIPPVITELNFGYSSKLKTEFKKGNIPLRYGAYGGRLKKGRASLEHIIPKSKGGKSCMSNYLLTTVENNWRRGDKPFIEAVNLRALLEYLRVMLDVDLKNLDGVEYVKNILDTMIKCIKEGK